MKRAIPAAAAAAWILCAAGEVFMRGGGNGEREVLFSSRARAGAFEGTLAAARVRGGCAALDAQGAAMCGRAAQDGLEFSARSYAARADGAARGMAILPGAGEDGAAAVFTFEGGKKFAHPPVPEGMPDFGCGMPEWSAGIEASRTAFASFRTKAAQSDAFASACAAYRANGWTALPGAGNGFAMFARGDSLAAVFAEADGEGTVLYAVQRGGG